MLTTDLRCPGGAPIRAELAIVDTTAFTDCAVIVAGRPRDVVRTGEPIEALRLAGRGPDRIRVTMRTDGWSSAIELRRDGDRYLLPAIAFPGAPCRVVVQPEGQEAPAGSFVIAPRSWPGTWTLTKDERNNARAPRLGPGPVTLRDHRPTTWRPTADGRVVVDTADLAIEAPLVDTAFAPLLPADLDRPLWSAPRLHAGKPGPITAWVPGYPPIELQLDAELRLRTRGTALQELAIEAQRRGHAVRLEAPGQRAVAWPAGRTCAAEEVLPTVDAFPLHAPSGRAAWSVWFRGLWLDVRVVAVGPESDQRILQLERPLPCDGRLGPDLGPFLPMRVVRGAGDHELLLQDAERMTIVEAHGERFRGDVAYESRWGLHPEWPREFGGRYAWNGLVWGRAGDGFGFFGWLLDPAFSAPASGPFPAYGFRAGPGGGSMRVGRSGPRPSLPPEVDAAVEQMLGHGAQASKTIGGFRLTAAYEDPRGLPLEIQVEPVAGRPLPSIRLFRR